MRRWWLRVVVSLAVAALLLAVVPLDEVLGAIRGVNPWIWIACVGIFVAGHSLNAIKLYLLIGPGGAPAPACVRAHFAGIASNLGLPGVAGGDIVRVSYLAPAAGTARVVMAAVADRLVDSFVLILIAVVAASVAGVPPAISGAMRTGGRWLVVIAVAGLVAGVAIRRRLRRSGRPPLGLSWSRIGERPVAIVLAVSIAIAVQAAFVLANVWLASAVGFNVALAPWFLAWTAAKLSAILPISLGGIGVREAALVSVLAAYGAPPDGALAVGILWQGALISGSLGGFLLTQALSRSPGVTGAGTGAG